MEQIYRTPSVLSIFDTSFVGIADVDIESDLGKKCIGNSNRHFASNSLDVLAIYIKGQKLLYTEAKTYCEQQLNFLMLPAIFISCVGSIFSFLSENYSYGPVIIASLNGFNAFLLALISYLKLDAKSQAHKTSAYKFDKLESYCEFNSGKCMFFETESDQIFEVVEKIEADVKEIKETNQFILPESIRYEFHFTYSTNVFTLVKRMQLQEISEINNLKQVLVRINAIKSKISAANLTNISPRQEQGNGTASATITVTESDKDALHLDETEKTRLINSILQRRKEYYEMDKQFNAEIEHHMSRVNKSFIFRILFCDWLKS